jgi:hypothetical protein
MQKAYHIAQEMVRDQLREHDPAAAAELEDVRESDIIVTRGQHDHIESVLKLASTPHTVADPADLESAGLRPDQVLFVNCPGSYSPAALRKVECFVREGGFLFTTDWALKNVLEPAFPGHVEYNSQATSDEVVRVEILAAEDPYLQSLIGPEDDPQWWLEESSYPIRVLDPEKVKVLVTSKEIARKYGEEAVFVTFDYGEGKIYHMISHFYLQRTETRTERHQGSGSNYASEKTMSPALMAKYKAMGSEEASLGEMESAYSSSAFMSKILLEKRRQARELEHKAREARRGKDEGKPDEKPGEGPS